MTDLVRSDSERILRPPGERGDINIADRVVVKIAGRAAGEAGVTLAAAKVRADGVGRSATVVVPIVVAYPSPVYEVAAQVRGHVSDRLNELVGVNQVDIRVVVAELVVGRGPARRRVV